MSSQDTLAYEAHNRPRQTAIAITAGVLLMLAAVLGLVGPHAPVSEATLALIYQHKRAALSLVAAIVNALGDAAIAVTLLYLWRCASARSDRPTPYIPVLIIVGAVVAIVGGLAYAVDIGTKASAFVNTGAQTYDEADRLTRGALLLVLQILSQLGSLLLAMSFVLVSLVAMRVGLLPRFLAYVGILAGVLVLFPVIVIPIVQLYWLAAVAILLSGNWPSGLPPAWRSGEAVPWPSSAEMRARRVAEAQQARDQRAARKGGGRGRRSTPDAPEGQATLEPPAADERSGQPTAASTPKRKRKRRH